MVFDSIGVIGYGPFAKLLIELLSSKTDRIMVYNRSTITDNLAQNVSIASLDEVAKAELLILALPFSAFEETLESIKESLSPDTVVLDVCSVKIKPIETMLRLVPENVSVVGSHPLFGPQSVDQLNQLTAIVCRGRGEQAKDRVIKLYEDLGWKVEQLSSEQHDKEMAVVHGLTFWIAQSLVDMNLKDPTLPTGFYENLRRLIKMQINHTPSLTRTVETDNPFSADIRQKFIDTSSRLDQEYRTDRQD